MLNESSMSTHTLGARLSHGVTPTRLLRTNLHKSPWAFDPLAFPRSRQYQASAWLATRARRDTGRAMAQENSELVDRVVAAVNERDVDGYVACCADDIKLRTPWAAVEGVYEGPEAIRRFFADLQDWAPDFRLTIERAEPIGATRVLVFLRASLSGRASGLPAAAMSGGLGHAPAAGALSTATVFDFGGGKVASIRVFLDRDQALKAVGRAEPAPQGDENPEPPA
jgi:ketosteroid isomerase-like protein